ncbi:MAG: DUF1801 domain-containing protein [Pseudomonadota bacterium]
MQYDAKTPTDYLDALSDDWRKSHLLKIRDLLFHAAPDLIERIHYKMLAYGDDAEELFHLNAQRGYVSLYAGNIDAVDPDRVLLSAFSTGKGCIRFRKSSNLDDDGLKSFIEIAVSKWRDGASLGC